MRGRWNRDFDNSQQHDASEAFTTLLQCCDRVDEDKLKAFCAGDASAEHALKYDFLAYTTPMWRIFGALQNSIITCERCGRRTTTVEPANLIQIAIDESKKMSLQQLLEMHLKKKPILDTDDMCGGKTWTPAHPLVVRMATVVGFWLRQNTRLGN